MDGYFQNNSRGGEENDDDNEFFNENAEEINDSSCDDRMLVAESESVFRKISKQGFRMGKSIRDERFELLDVKMLDYFVGIGAYQIINFFLLYKEIADRFQRGLFLRCGSWRSVWFLFGCIYTCHIGIEEGSRI